MIQPIKSKIPRVQRSAIPVLIPFEFLFITLSSFKSAIPYFYTLSVRNLLQLSIVSALPIIRTHQTTLTTFFLLHSLFSLKPKNKSAHLITPIFLLFIFLLPFLNSTLSQMLSLKNTTIFSAVSAV